jgi:hypothetical protein
MMREFSEDFLGMPERDGSSSASHDPMSVNRATLPPFDLSGPLSVCRQRRVVLDGYSRG